MGCTNSDASLYGYCFCPRSSAVRVKTPIVNTDWADAVTKLNIAGIKMLHATDPDLIDEGVDEYGSTAVQVAIKHKHYGLLRYFLENDADINVKGGKEGNTALHEAVIMEDTISTKWLFAFNANPKLTNRHRKKPFEVCRKAFKKTYIRAKQSRDRYWNGSNDRNKIFEIYSEGTRSSSPITVAGISIENTQFLQAFVEETNDERIYYNIKKEEIKNRKHPITEFGANVGVEIDEIAFLLQKIQTKQRLWNIWIHEDVATVKSVKSVYTILFGLTWLCLKKKYGTKARKPSSTYIKQITKTLWLRYLPKNSRNHPILSTEDFTGNFHSYLYQLHDQMLFQKK